LQDKLENGGISTFWPDVAQKFEQGLTAYTGYLSGNAAEKRDMVKLVSSNLVVHKKDPIIPMVFPFNEIRNWSKLTYGGPHQGAVRTLGVQGTQDRRRKRSNVAELFKRISNRDSKDTPIHAEISP
jgi:hypothetical protein